MSFERPEDENKIANVSYLEFLQTLNPGPFSLVLSSIDWPGPLAPTPKFPLTHLNGDLEEVPVVRGINYFASVKPAGILHDVLETLLHADVEKLSLSCSVGLNQDVTVRATVSGEATGADLASSPVAGATAAAPAASLAVKAYKFAGIQQVDVTELAFMFDRVDKGRGLIELAEQAGLDLLGYEDGAPACMARVD